MLQTEINSIKKNGALNGLAASFNSICWDLRRDAEKLTISDKNALSALANLECKLASLRQLHHEYVTLSKSE